MGLCSLSLRLMLQTLDILQAAHRNTIDSRMELMDLKEQQIPGSVHYVIRRYNTPKFITEDKGMLVYHYSKSQPEENFFELRFCITGKTNPNLQKQKKPR